nr:MAG TPA: hypothetical protein [Caudoviricetes sp.]
MGTMNTKTKPFTGRIKDNVFSQLKTVFIKTLQKCGVFYVTQQDQEYVDKTRTYRYNVVN